MKINYTWTTTFTNGFGLTTGFVISSLNSLKSIHFKDIGWYKYSLYMHIVKVVTHLVGHVPLNTSASACWWGRCDTHDITNTNGTVSAIFSAPSRTVLRWNCSANATIVFEMIIHIHPSSLCLTSPLPTWPYSWQRGSLQPSRSASFSTPCHVVANGRRWDQEPSS